jgi:protein dithiol oxidoreductase (disulfide-forming)
MFKKTLLVASVLFFSQSAFAAEGYQAGKHYNVMTSPVATAKNNEVTEYFSVYCPHCYTLEGMLPGITPHLAEGVSLEKSHVDFLRMADTSLQEAFSRALIVAEKEGKKQALIEAAFATIHDEKQRPKDKADVVALMKTVGITQDKIASMDSFVISSQLRTAQASHSALIENKAIRGVPTLIVEGKYIIDLAQLDRANFRRDLADLINYLTQLDGV